MGYYSEIIVMGDDWIIIVWQDDDGKHLKEYKGGEADKFLCEYERINNIQYDAIDVLKHKMKGN